MTMNGLDILMGIAAYYILMSALVLLWSVLKRDKLRCYNGGQKHKYQAVFEEVQAPWLNLGGHSKNISRDMMFEKQYVKHVCLWCGKGSESLKAENER